MNNLNVACIESVTQFEVVEVSELSLNQLIAMTVLVAIDIQALNVKSHSKKIIPIQNNILHLLID